MKVVLNKCYGGFELSEFAAARLGCDPMDGKKFRASEALVDLIEVYGSDACSDSCADLRVVEVPDCASDQRVFDYDGIETLIYVVDGKLFTL